MSESAEKDQAPLNVLADLIDRWWETADQPTALYDGVEHLASLSLARSLLAAGVSIIPAAQTGPDQ